MDLQLYENYPRSELIYQSIPQMLEEIPSILTDDDIVIYLINWGFGFGSAITVFIQNMYYLHSLNAKLLVLPHFSKNTTHFKYHDSSLHNSFFRYFQSIKTLDLQAKKVYFCHSTVLDEIPFFQDVIPSLSNPVNKRYIDCFRQWYQLRISITQIPAVKKRHRPLIGIHMRSYAQKVVHHQGYLHLSMKRRIAKLKRKLDHTFHKYDVFIMTDVTKYLKMAKKRFGKIHYLKHDHRVKDEDDSVPLLSQYIGLPLGLSFLHECYQLSFCDYIYLSLSNTQYMVNIINPNASISSY